MDIILMRARFADYDILYSPELEMPSSPNIQGKCYPAVMVDSTLQFEPEYFYLHEFGDFEEYRRHPDKGLIYQYLGGKKNVVTKFQNMHRQKG